MAAIKATKQVFGWEEIFTGSQALANRVRDYHPDTVIAIARGGMIPARLIAEQLNVRRIYNIGLEFYQGVAKTAKGPRIYQDLPPDMSNKRICVVDDIVDSGESFIYTQNHLIERGCLEFASVSLFYKPNNIFRPDDYYKQISRDIWVVMPWELD